MIDGLDYNMYNMFRALTFLIAMIHFMASIGGYVGVDPMALALLFAKRMGTAIGSTMSSMFASLLGLI